MPNRARAVPSILITAGLIVACALLVAGILIYPKFRQQWSAPLGPGLGLPTHTAAAQETLPGLAARAGSGLFTQEAGPTAGISEAPGTGLPEASAAASGASSPAAIPPALAAVTPTPQPLCGGPATSTILAVGADSGIDYRYGLADVIRLIRVDFVTPKVSVLSIPRDLWVEIPGLEEHNITHGKLNQSYFYGGDGMGYYHGPGAGPGLLARTLDLNFGVAVDHYGAVNMQTFVKIVDAVGGIDLYLPTDVDGRPIDSHTIDLGYFNAGNQHLNGEAALRLARIRKKYNDFTRMDHQNMVLCALKEKLLTPAVLPKIPRIISSFQGSVQTDLSPEQISQMACLLPRLKSENLLFTSLPDDLFSPGRVYSPIQKDTTFVLEADYEVIRDYLARFMSGAWPTEPSEGSGCP